MKKMQSKNFKLELEQRGTSSSRCHSYLQQINDKLIDAENKSYKGKI